jgi:arylsulfatase A-like enzyme
LKPPRLGRWLAAFPWAVLALTIHACAAPEPPPRNVLFILVDTLRADHLPLYGYGRDTSPNLQVFARGASFFSDVRSQASCTFPSVNSIWTSRSPGTFEGQAGGAMGLPAAVPGIADLLAGHGFHTVAISASPIVRKNPSRFNPGGGFARGFETFDENCLWHKADCVSDRALSWLHPDPRPLFLYLHYIDPHGPYAPPATYTHRFALHPTDKDFIRRGDPNPIANWVYKGAPNPGITAADIGYLKDLYDDDIAFFDSQLQRILTQLQANGMAKDTLVVFAADHGEEFLEHGGVKHCHTLFETAIRVPLLFRVPGTPARKIDGAVQNLDILPTILDYLKIVPSPQLEGHSLRALIDGSAPTSPRYQWSAQGSLRSVADGHFKLILDTATKRVSLYDLVTDPGETRDVLTAKRADFIRLRDALAQWRHRHEGSGGDEAEKKLRSLGYLD